MADRMSILVTGGAGYIGSHCCKALAEESHLTKAAQDYSDDMSARNFFSHTNPEGVTFDQRIKNAGNSKPGAEIRHRCVRRAWVVRR